MRETHCGHDDRLRCAWCGDDPRYQRYHDDEWGMPVADDRRLFEKLSLESFQAGLSWLTILNKRDSFRLAFAHFDVQTLATWGAADIERLMANASIVRHRGKIAAVLNNARCVQRIVAEQGSLAGFLWQFEPEPKRTKASTALSQTAESAAMASALKAYGWSFFGPTTAYAFMQSMGMVNDHAANCFRQAAIDSARLAFHRPSAKLTEDR